MSDNRMPDDQSQVTAVQPARPVDPADARREARRRILRAAVGAPVVFTLPSGAALAATSSQCEANAQEMAFTQSASMPDQVTGSPDGWLRYSVQKYLIPQSGANVYGFVLIDRYNQEAWYKVEGGAAIPVTLMPGSGAGNKPSAVAGQYYYLLVNYEKFQQSSDPAVFADPQETNYSPMSGSCWTSISAGNVSLSSDVTI